jgi:parallel beta-helix repeat protein
MQAIVVRPGRLNDSTLFANVTSDSGDGIHLQTDNTGNTLTGNVAERNVPAFCDPAAGSEISCGRGAETSRA